jgi:hypothetical protein
LATALQEQNDGDYNYQDCNYSYYVVNYLILFILFTQLVTPKLFAMLGLTLAVIVAIIAYSLVTLTNQKISTEAITTTRSLSG